MNKKSELPKYGGMEDAMIKAGIIGATGYAGQELVRLLLQHKEVEIVWYGSRSYVDKNLVPFLEMFFRLCSLAPRIFIYCFAISVPQLSLTLLCFIMSLLTYFIVIIVTVFPVIMLV